jgi:hypothetical protein
MKLLIKKIVGFLFKKYFFLFNKGSSIVFLFHEISNYPSIFQKDNELNLKKKKFIKMINWINNNFNIVNPKKLNFENKFFNALISFDDGFKESFNFAIPFMEKKNIYSIHFLNFKPILYNDPNIAAVLCYIEKNFSIYKKYFQKKNFVSPYYLNIDNVQYNKHIKNKVMINFSKIKKFQGQIVNSNLLKKYNNFKYCYFANHFYEHWNTICCKNKFIIKNYKDNKKFLTKLKNNLDYLALTNGKIKTCYSQKNINLLFKQGVKKIFTSNGTINYNKNKDVFDRVSIVERYADDINLMFFDILFNRIKFFFKSKNI